MYKTISLNKSILFSATLLVLTACGGGSGSDGNNSAAGGGSKVSGNLDPAFGGGSGVVLSSAGSNSTISDNLLVFSDGTLGQVSFPTIGADSYLQTAHFNIDGSVNASPLGSLGSRACKTFISGTSACTFGPSLVQADGKIIQTYMRQTTSSVYTTVLLRFNKDGSLDNTFGSAGISEFSSVQAWTNPVRIQQQVDGKLLVLTKLMTDPAASGSNPKAFPVVLRYNVDGTLDSTFGGTGYVKLGGQFSSNKDWIAYGMDINVKTGQIYVAGERYNSTYNYEAFALRLNSNGSVDNTFGSSSSATAIYQAYDQIDIAVEPSTGEVFVTGRDYTNQYVYMTKLLTSGAPDWNFGFGGEIQIPVSISGEVYSFQRMHMGADGMLYVLGATNSGSTNRIVMVRLATNGGYDTSFGNGAIAAGLYTSDTSAYPNLFMSDFRFMADGRLALGGAWMSGSSYYTALMVLH